MQVSGFEFHVFDVDGCRVIEGIYPPVIDVSRLSPAISEYYDLWDEETPTVSLVGLSRLIELAPEVRKILGSVVQRTILQPGFIDGAWYVGVNPALREDLVKLLIELGRSGTSVFETRDEALAFLRRSIAAWREEGPTGRIELEAD